MSEYDCPPKSMLDSTASCNKSGKESPQKDEETLDDIVYCPIKTIAV